MLTPLNLTTLCKILRHERLKITYLKLCSYWVWIQAGRALEFSNSTILCITGKRENFESARTGLNQAFLLWPWASLIISLNFCFLIGKSWHEQLASESYYMLVSLSHLTAPPTNLFWENCDYQRVYDSFEDRCFILPLDKPCWVELLFFLRLFSSLNFFINK